MCGICGIIDSKNIVEKNTISRMNDAMSHRGPNDSGIYLNSDNEKAPFCGLGHRRLSILDLSKVAGQPMYNEDKSIWLVFNGEIYNYQELRVTLIDKGHTFRSNTDSEVLVHLYEEYRENCLSHLNGMFAFAIWDDNEKSLFLARDRVGKKPLNYYFDGNIFAFSSEFLSLLQSGLIKKEVNLEAVDDYLSFGYIPAPKTGYKNIFKLPPAHYLIFKDKKIDIRRYWEIDFSKKINVSFDEAKERIYELFTDSVKLRMASDVPLGAFLSGGLDSSAVVSVLSKLSSSKIKTFSIGFKEAAYNELDYARAVAKYFDTDHHEFVVESKALDVLPELIERYGEPFADSSAIPTYYVSKLTKEHVTVALNGDGGDEIFGGYERYAAMQLAEHYRKIPGFLRNYPIKAIYKMFPDSVDPKNKLRRIRRFLEGAESPASYRYLRWLGVFNDSSKQKIYTDNTIKFLGTKSTSEWFSSFFKNSKGLNLIDNLLYCDTKLYLPFDLLVKVDIASMTNSLEARAPFLDYRLMEYVASLPPAFKIKGMTTKYLLKKTFEDRLPSKNIFRKKMGFGVPIRNWFRNELKDYVRDVLLSPVSLNRGYFKPDVITTMVNDHVKGTRDNANHLWSLLMLELWHRRFIDSP